MGPPGQKLSIEVLNTVETSVETWLDFCNASMSSQFYQVALERTADPELAAAMTLLRNYIGTFAEAERARLESDAEYFYRYAKGFIDELAPYRYNASGYDTGIRSAFIGKIRALLAGQKDSTGQVTNQNLYVFVRTIVRFCSSLAFIVRIHDQYKRFLFRELPQIRSNIVLD